MSEPASVVKPPRCPACGWTDVRYSMPKGVMDRLVKFVGLVPYRCRSCGRRFYRTDHHHEVEPET